MNAFVYALLAGTAISAISFVGFASVLVARKRLAWFQSAMVAFAAGGLLAAVFLDLLPESVEQGGPTFPMALLGLILFFLTDSLLWVYHCHAGHRLHEGHDGHGSCPVKPMGWLNLLGDAIHNFADGVVVASAFLVSPALGLTTSVVVGLHEIPQEMGDFGILIHSGFTPKRALKWNVVVSLTMLLGIVGTFAAASFVTGLTAYTIPLAAGGFLYLACTNLLAEIKEEESLPRRLIQIAFFVLGIALLWAGTLLER